MMIFDVYDFEFLRLCGLCRYLPTGLLRRFDCPYFKPEIIATLRNNGYIKMQSDKLSYKLTFSGKEILADMGYTFPDDLRMDINRSAYHRKLKNAWWNITLHLAGIDVFIKKMQFLAGMDIGYVSSLTLRTDDSIRVLAGTRFLGILKMFDTAYIPYFVEGQDDWIVPTYEREIYKSQVNLLPSVKDIQLILTGESLEELWADIHPISESKNMCMGKKRFDIALKELGHDYSIVPIGGNGVMQLDVMKVWRYRERIAMGIGCDTTKVFNLPECDGFINNVPVIVAIDFNIPRILRALKQIEIYNENIVPKICCLTFQADTISRLLQEYRTQACSIASIDISQVNKILSNNIIIKNKMQEPYIREGGAYISANQRKITKVNFDEPQS